MRGSVIIYDLFSPTPQEMAWGGRSLWYSRIASSLGCTPTRAKDLSLDRVVPNGSEIKLYELALSGEINLQNTFTTHKKRMERKYDSLRT